MVFNTKLPNWFVRGVSEIFPFQNDEKSLETIFCEALNNKKQLRIKLGIDPTGTDIHLGHSILFRKLRAFQDNGHKAILIIGDFTAQIGDPTGKNKTRIQLSENDVKRNAETYLQQLGLGKSADKSILDFETEGRLEIRHNSE